MSAKRAALALVLALLPCRTASAEEPPLWEPGEPTTDELAGEVRTPSAKQQGDGAYGRFDGDSDLGIGFGVDRSPGSWLGAARVSAFYFSTVGVYAHYADSLGRDADLERLAAFGVELRPLFVARWASDAEQGPGVLDLTLDSLTLGTGAYFAEPRTGVFGDERGFELATGFGLPLTGHASGPWLESRGLLRVSDPSEARADLAFWLLVSWHAIFTSGLAE